MRKLVFLDGILLFCFVSLDVLFEFFGFLVLHAAGFAGFGFVVFVLGSSCNCLALVAFLVTGRIANNR